jgi:hypothetical protein
MFHFDGGDFVPIMIFAIPIVAIVGGITAGIVKTLGQQRLIELAQRERILALEKGIDPSKLPPLPVPSGDDDLSTMYLSPRQAALRRAQGLLIGGIITLAVGIGVGIFLYVLTDGEDQKRVWAVGLIPALVGLALLLSSFIVRGSAPDDDRVPANPPRVV